MEFLEKHLIDIEVKFLDDVPDGAFLAILEEKGISPEDLSVCYDHDPEGYCLCKECIDVEAEHYRGKWNGPEDEKPELLQ